MQQTQTTLSLQEMTDLIELAVLACRTERDKRFVQGIVQKLNDGQSVPELNGEFIQDGELPEPSLNGK